ncbi:hypothetical protein [Micavibrio aeruginosavorus]|uniref:Uncharacterized domain protein n=1 Tax=Micavibrio aeruginosavorus (strain ARL-13) TaxID=856793 RepID=G2KQD3_MICAA|nr:hypothetical protein [Micavibrio aeruginosavorus]AEP09069.1 putative uncharacterized domain protein [Micavibrio aeruginosavorus ARL-13]
MRVFIALLTGIFLFLTTHAATAQLAGHDTAPGTSCSGFPSGATRLTADADQDGASVILVCDGTTWNAAQSSSGGGGQSGTFTFEDSNATCDSSNSGMMIFDSNNLLKLCADSTWHVVFAPHPVCRSWAESSRVNCGGSYASTQSTQTTRAACQTWCEAQPGSRACEHIAGTNTCRSYNMCDVYGVSSNASYAATMCYGG